VSLLHFPVPRLTPLVAQDSNLLGDATAILVLRGDVSTTDHPKFGARFLFERSTVDEEWARYSVVIYLPDGLLRYDLKVDVEKGALHFEETGREPSERADPETWVDTRRLAFARTIARSAGGQSKWPRRIFVWRDS
tara:strand:+ start:91 stop:498 length:408 start_codon:yes stop_codon:yes gene_type:complete